MKLTSYYSGWRVRFRHGLFAEICARKQRNEWISCCPTKSVRSDADAGARFPPKQQQQQQMDSLILSGGDAATADEDNQCVQLKRMEVVWKKNVGRMWMKRSMLLDDAALAIGFWSNRACVTAWTRTVNTLQAGFC